MSTDPDFLPREGVESHDMEGGDAPRGRTYKLAQSGPWNKKTCGFVLDLAEVLKVAREKLVPEVESLAFRLVLLGILFYHIGTFLVNLLKAMASH